MDKANQAAKVIWDYMHLNQPLKKSDVILALGCKDLQIPHVACDLYFAGYAPIIIFSGGGVLKTLAMTEAEAFRNIALQRGVPANAIFIENQSKNTGENIELSKHLILEKNIPAHSFIVVHKPYIERRVYATFKKIWPEPDIVITSEKISYEDYVDHNHYYSKDELLNSITASCQRIVEYPKKGFQIEQPLTDEALAALDYLVKAGFTKKLIKV